jgi:rubredoxin
MLWVGNERCQICGFIYVPEEYGRVPLVIQRDWACPGCGSGSEYFEPEDEPEDEPGWQ